MEDTMLMAAIGMIVRRADAAAAVILATDRMS
jgi:hypothetical protein